ncbi:dicarboxylate/amino acid:cation symporter [Selenomonas caprae]|jgi:Na+/H+-dicarboxylate symporter|uniref:Na+/H+-dicarboxylate symporter n=2 Tax=Selenomonas TaxID=970 RepID=A0A1I3IFF6_SELRU|nr:MULTISPECIES: dicarboxylate/amino acid:cation symporter [Selenomonas]TYZ28588.1 dicarboxylate/amino acid:cation symporter [Selenomonas caprae]SFI46557.1 Na+/H+-dicarboxylate symporter [Selenomonas ruminantium]
MAEKKAGMSLDKLGIWIIAATVLGAVVGLVMGEPAHMFAPMGNLFMQLIKMVVVPLVLFSLIGGAASLGKSSSAGKIGALTFVYYGITTAVAVALGLLFSELFRPGAGIDMAALSGAAVQVEHMEESTTIPGFWETVTGFVPANPFKALVDGNILQIIVFAMFMGFASTYLEEKKKAVLIDFFNYMTELFIKIMTAIMYVAPLGVFCLMADATGTFGYAVLAKIMYLIVLYVVVLAIVTYGMIGGSVALFSKCTSYTQFFKSMWKVQIFAFSTASSMATLPLNMNTAMKELGVSKETTSFALPLGATINMNGNAAYYAMAATFIAQMYGMELSLMQYLAIIITSTLGAVGQAGVPGPTLLVVAVLAAAGIPIEALPILFGVDRIFDMLRTAVNITGDAACATIVDRFRDTSAAAENMDAATEH